ncbi:MAG: VWA domain-containing protein [Steroidobacteraceae bacterium]
MGVTALESFHFLHPAWLLALPALLVFAFGLGRRGRRRAPPWSSLVDPHLQPLLRIDTAGRSRSPLPWLAGAWALAVVALAGPAWRRLETPAYRLPAAWVVLMDLSPSMAATDVAPDRATRARYAVADLLAAAHDARVGLVAFAGEAYTVAPLTSDVATVRALLKALSPSLMPETGHRLAPALRAARRLLRSSPGVQGHVIVLSDGPVDPAAAMEAAASLRKHGATVDVVGIGTAPGAPQPDGHGGFVHDAAGRTVMTRLATDELRRIAQAGGGRYVDLRALPTLIAALEAAHSDRPDARAAAVPRVRVPHFMNGGVWLLLPLLALGALLARKGWL